MYRSESKDDCTYGIRTKYYKKINRNDINYQNIQAYRRNKVHWFGVDDDLVNLKHLEMQRLQNMENRIRTVEYEDKWIEADRS